MTKKNRVMNEKTDSYKLENFVDQQHWRAEIQHGLPLGPVKWCDGKQRLINHKTVKKRFRQDHKKGLP
jgi:hypothetical protein